LCAAPAPAGKSCPSSASSGSAIERLEAEGWQAEATPEYGFVFVRRGTDRRLLTLTPRDPYDTAPQSFSPFPR